MGHIIVFLLAGGYGWGIWKFLQGFQRTNYSQGQWSLALLWPLLYIVNGSYRENFQKALRDR
ncbi:hypothetical protein [Prochlorothrix hollandica]|uniref:Membrane protein n=1 Tax=Prochlorothrix hollandica PCC 9006 = CALU 1027 TaxID=317619 RepID=A0A0M2PZ58_PROHO|nr:hypothetical protein [Prochlorothrix hollandica]KKI99978.1 membrane protein [Prochlorothrix hollandica PCC 9006 = CALU 1027]